MGVPFLKLIPVFCSDSSFGAIRGKGRRLLFEATFLHVNTSIFHEIEKNN
jgi:hypothetical protein